MADDYVDANGWIRWVEPQERFALPPVRDERDEEDDDDGDDEDGEDDDTVRVAGAKGARYPQSPMGATERSLDLLSLRFPRLGERAASLYDRQESFRALCDAWALCARAVRRSESSPSRSLGARYAAQQRRLEGALRRRLEEEPEGVAFSQ